LRSTRRSCFLRSAPGGLSCRGGGWGSGPSLGWARTGVRAKTTRGYVRAASRLCVPPWFASRRGGWSVFEDFSYSLGKVDTPKSTCRFLHDPGSSEPETVGSIDLERYGQHYNSWRWMKMRNDEYFRAGCCGLESHGIGPKTQRRPARDSARWSPTRAPSACWTLIGVRGSGLEPPELVQQIGERQTLHYRPPVRADLSKFGRVPLP
jgi:hypothetical protein